MIFVSHQLPVNVPGEPVLDRAAVWDGLVLKANNALPFVPSMTYCEVTQRHGDTVFDRDIDFRGERFTERITLEQPHRVTFTRIAGPVLGTIANEIEGPDDDLKLRFSFALVVTGVEGGSAAEQVFDVARQEVIAGLLLPLSRDFCLGAREPGDPALPGKHFRTDREH